MQPDLADFLARHTPLAELTADWGQGRFAFLVTGYLTRDLPPLEYVTSVRGLVFRGDAMLCLRDGEGVHLFPGGRREPGETLEETLWREVREESGCLLAEMSRLGFMLFYHVNPAPPGYRYPYPHFVQLVYVAEAAEAEGDPLAMPGEEDPYRFRAIAEVQSLDLSASQRLFLGAALAARSTGVTRATVRPSSDQ